MLLQITGPHTWSFRFSGFGLDSKNMHVYKCSKDHSQRTREPVLDLNPLSTVQVSRDSQKCQVQEKVEFVLLGDKKEGL